MKDENNFSDFKDRILDNFKGKIMKQDKVLEDTIIDLKKEKLGLLSNLIDPLPCRWILSAG